MNVIRILLVDDHKIIRDGLRSYLANDPRYKIIGEAENGRQALEFLEHNDLPEVVLMDISMDEMDGIECTQEIRKKHPKIKIIGLSMLKESVYVKKFIKAGASGYLVKNSDEEEVKLAIETVRKDNTYYSKEIMQKMLDDLSVHKSSKDESSKFMEKIILTNREKEILNLIVHEYSNGEIADKLFISLRTVEAHKRNLLEKTGAKNIAGLVKFALQHEISEE